MRFIKIGIYLFFLILLSSCSKIEREVIFYTQTDEKEIQSDFDFHLTSIKKYLDKHSITHSRYNDLKKLRSSIPDGIQQELKDEDAGNFMMIMIDKTGKSKIHHNFGTDVDLMMSINEFYQIE